MEREMVQVVQGTWQVGEKRAILRINRIFGIYVVLNSAIFT